jgi:MscS family membrane protein
VIDRIGRVYFHEIPSETDGPRYLWHRGPLGRIALARRADQLEAGWRFTDSTVAGLDQAISLMQDMGTPEDLDDNSNRKPGFLLTPGLWIRWHMPPALRWHAGFLALWQWIAAGLALAALFVTYVVMHFVVDPLAAWIGGLTTKADLERVRRDLRGFRFFVIVLLGYLMLPLLDLPVRAAGALYTFDKFLLATAIIWAGVGITDFIRLTSARRTESSRRKGFQDLIVPFMCRLFKIVLVVAVLIYLISCFDEGALMGRFLAGLGVVGLAVSLAAQDSIKNLFATMLLFADKSFAVGDKVSIGSHEGTVEEVGFRSTRLRTRDDSVLILPNSTVAGGTIDNQAMRVHQRVAIQFNFDPAASPKALLELQQKANVVLAEQSEVDVKRLEVSLHGVSEKGVELRVVAYVRGKGEKARAFRQEVTLAILGLSQDLGLKIMTDS